MRTDFMFKGMMVPVFTPFHDDKMHTINYEMIDKYAHYLKTKGMHGVMVNGITGEGMTLTVDERKRLAEEWFKVTRKYDLKMLLNIGGMPLPHIYELAEHAEKLMVDAVMIMPDTFYHPYSIEDMVMYMKDIATRMPTRPIMYYHMPSMTHIHIDLLHFVELMERELRTFTGIYYAHDHLDHIMNLKLKKPDYVYIIGLMSSMLGYMIEGFEAFSMTAMNLYPEMVKEMYDHMHARHINEALMVHDKFVLRVHDLFPIDSHLHYVQIMKMEMDKLYTTTKMGPIRMPKMTIDHHQIMYADYHKY